ncbi:hypothetical protein LS684_20985 (plasmid) [Cytobacillus spongiae]|uniref:replicative helicase loader/inhibitor n=1 Tax=Cytobacillus spongiae TaxID=2901381 RepID=UPI001F16CA02|nr:replicative helicase loader/inhibitor [Cytobacillus spongiae]UII58101.1 hypothetical protein LS684_20985 [Cytobacillus spongiae]
MNREQVKSLFKRIKEFYGNFDVYSEKVDAWASVLKKFEYEFVTNNLEQHILTNKFAPTISDLVNAPEKEIPSGPVVPTAEETQNMFKERAKERKNAASPEVRERELAKIRKILNIPNEVTSNDTTDR